MTDEDQVTFVGTLQYSSPEFLMRDEIDTMDGWRAVTFYQLGAVLHDMIMRKRIFSCDLSQPVARWNLPSEETEVKPRKAKAVTGHRTPKAIPKILGDHEAGDAVHDADADAAELWE